MAYRTGTKRPRKPLSEEGKPGRYDRRNTVNDLTGKEWLLLSRSFWITESAPEDRDGYKHPAPFLVGDVQRLISLYTKCGMTVLDPFAGIGSALVAAAKLGRKGIGIDLSRTYCKLTRERLSQRKLTGCEVVAGDAFGALDSIGEVDYIVTSPPYHNILRNNGKGIRHANGKAYRRGARDGVEYYSKHANDLGNFDRYDDFLLALYRIMRKAYDHLQPGRYCTIIISDFTVDRVETCVQGDVVRLMEAAGYHFAGTTVLLQTVKPLYPFGYPYAYKVNHHHQNLITFRKPTVESSHSARRRTVVHFGEAESGECSEKNLLAVRVFDEKTKKIAYNKQTQAAKGKNKSNCPLCAVGDNANKARIYGFDEMDADHVAAWSKGGDSSANNCEMLCVTHNRAKGNR